MHVETCPHAAGFLEATSAYRAADPLRTNVLSTVATSVADGSASYSSCRWWLVLDEDDALLGAAMRTVPHALALGPMHDAPAALLASSVARDDDALPVVSGARRTVEAFLDAYRASGSPGSSRELGDEEVHVLYAVEDVALPRVDGELAVATAAELELAERWFGAFDEELAGVRRARSEDDHAMLRGVVASGRLRWWRRGGEVVSMAGHATPVGEGAARVTRVGPVYTPPGARRRGYGAAVTGHLSVELLSRGSRVMLFADASNPTSNHVYQDLGFERVDEVVRVPFVGAVERVR